MKSPSKQSLLLEYFLKAGMPPFDTWFSNLSKSLRLAPSESLVLWQGLKQSLKSGFWHQFLSKQSLTDSIEQQSKNLSHYLESTDLEWTPQILNKKLNTDVEVKFIRNLGSMDPKFALGVKFIRAGFPPWLFNSFLKRIDLSKWSDLQIEKFIISFQKSPPLYLRINLSEEKQNILADLKNNGFQINLLGPLTLEVSGPRGIYQVDSWKRGWIEIQDQASQQVGDLIKAKPGQRILDLCAGNGGKTIQMAGKLMGKGVIYALDIKESKIKTLKNRLARTGYQMVRSLVWGGQDLPVFGKEITSQGGFDWVLVDSPCSASGTWHRDPEGPYRLTQSSLQEIISIQKTLLPLGLKTLNPTGRLVYSTCSWLPEENESILEEWSEKLQEMHFFGPPEQNSSFLFGGCLFKGTTSV